MWRSASTSDARRRAPGRAALAVLAALGACSLSGAAELASADAVLLELFGPTAAAERRTAFLDAEQLDAVEAIAGTRPGSKIVTWYEVRGGGGAVAGRAWLDTHLVRTLQETLLVVLSPEGAVLRVEVLSFHEPREYLPSARWFAQFDGRELDEELRLRRAIRLLAGATLSSRSVTDAVRRALALDRIVGRAGAR